ncbi:NADPH2:quinone reductase [Motilibacter rhizosphaerae]|uniref:NADPH2:quinone reductase n=1 Tax=Motilibacter rhizosphaerae TaxID=598652 RepID=A0A4Q7NWJ0_9ACTN|nr:quinone oxidoreductase [Motilibacter rhizosphaerae]RZS91577.1 NADPH2:quinone reductase [Motilibacter rhizosphaerae]
MRAVVVTESGGPEVLELQDRESPTPGPGELLVEVEAAGVNYMDIYAREGRPPYTRETPYVLGAEGAGRVTELGEGVEGVSVGSTVAWTGVPGSYAEQVLVPADRAVPVPDGVDAQTAAAVMLQGCTAHYLASTTYPVGEGDVTVVHAAAGGVGLLLTQIIRARGGIVVATTSGGEKAELAQRAGAQHVASYDDYADVVREVSAGAGAAVVYDGVGASTFDTSLQVLRRRGLLVLYGAASGPVPPFELQRLSSGGSLFITRPTLGDHIVTREELVGRTDELFGWIAAGELDVRIGATYALADAARAHEDLAGRRTTGKLLLLP